MENFTPYSSLAGGILIGISASILMYLNGRIAGVSGIAADLFNRLSLNEKAWRLAFIVGLVGGAFVYATFFPIDIAPRENMTTGLLIGGGLLIGFGTAMGGGCTSGHGVCGISRFSVRALVATLTFICSGVVTVYLLSFMRQGI